MILFTVGQPTFPTNNKLRFISLPQAEDHPMHILSTRFNEILISNYTYVILISMQIKLIEFVVEVLYYGFYIFNAYL